MKKRLFLVIILILGVTAITMILLNGTGFAQNISRNDQELALPTTDPVQDDQNSLFPWDTSAPVPEGAQIQNIPDRLPGIDPLDAADRAIYNASLRIAGSVLRPRTMVTGLEWGVGGEGGCLYVSAGDQYIWFNTPLNLPQGSTIQYFRMYYNDQNATYDSVAFITVYDLYGSIVEEHNVLSSGTGKYYATTAELGLVVDYDNYSYVIQWKANSLGISQQVCGFRIYYQTPPGLTYLPLVINGE